MWGIFTVTLKGWMRRVIGSLRVKWAVFRLCTVLFIWLAGWIRRHRDNWSAGLGELADVLEAVSKGLTSDPFIQSPSTPNRPRYFTLSQSKNLPVYADFWCGPYVLAQVDIRLFEWPGDVGYESTWIEWDEAGKTWVTKSKIVYPPKGTLDVPINYIMEPPATLGPLLVDLGIFPSRGEAKRNGWDKPFPKGWAELKIGKHRITIWNPTEAGYHERVQEILGG